MNFKVLGKKMLSFGIKFILFIVLFAILICIRGCQFNWIQSKISDFMGLDGNNSTKVAQINITREEAYKVALQNIVNKYGMIDEYKLKLASNSEYSLRGLIEAKLVNLNNDDERELMVLYANGQYINMEIYEFDGKSAIKRWNEEAPRSMLCFGISNVNNKVYWYYGPTWHKATALYIYRNGMYDTVDTSSYFRDDYHNTDPDLVDIETIAMNKDNTIMDFSMYSGMSDYDIKTLVSKVQSLVSRWELFAPQAEISTLEALSGIKYYGDKTKCKMTKEMALAYKSALESEGYDSLAVLMDLSGDGMPLLITYNDMLNVWTWDGANARKYDFTADTESSFVLGVDFYPNDGEGIIIIGDGLAHDAGGYSGTIVYTVSNASLTIKTRKMMYSVYIDSQANIAKGGKIPELNVTHDENGQCVSTVSELLNAGWGGEANSNGEYYSLSTLYIDGKQIAYNDITSAEEKFFNDIPGNESWNIYYESTGASYPEPGTWSTYAEINNALNLYSKVNKKEKVKVNIEYGNISNGVQYLEDVFKSINGTVPDDESKNNIANYAGSYITQKGQAVIKSKKNKVTLDEEQLSNAVNGAKSAQREMSDLMSNYNIQLNKDIPLNLRFVCENININKKVQFVITKELINSMSDADELKFVINDDKHCIKINRAALESICGSYSKCTISIIKNEDGKYEIEFADEKGKTIKQLSENIGFVIPSDNNNNTVYAKFGKTDINWGGTYNADLGTIEFSTPYGGTYTVVENDVKVNDLSNFSEEEKKAVEFLVSRGIFNLENGNFRPDEVLTRYEFAEAFVKIFFEYDEELTTNFPDVAKDSYYYPYVASGESIKVIQGYPDGNFYGEKAVIKEEVLALCCRILMEQKGYNLPANPFEYIKFNDNNAIKWGEVEIALTVREGLIDGTGILNPSAEITRKEGAEILYKLYMLLHGTEDAIKDELSHTENTNNILIIATVISVIILIILAVILLMVIKKKRAKKIPAASEKQEITQ